MRRGEIHDFRVLEDVDPKSESWTQHRCRSCLSLVGSTRKCLYPVPDPSFPFLGVHFTRRVHGGVEAGPNAVLALAREGYHKASFDLRDAWSVARWPGPARRWRRPRIC